MSTVDELFFVHIPKNGGRSIVAVGKSNNIDWGYHYWKTQNVQLWHVPYSMYKYPKDPSHCFAVVRNPYERLISAYNFANREDTINNLMNNEKSAKRFNQWIFSKVFDVQPLLEDVKSNIHKYKQNMNIHVIPQYLFTHDETGNEVVFHILKFENLENDFKFLMKEHNSDIDLGIHIGKSEQIITPDWLSIENILLINQVYSKDFEYFGYEKLIELE